MVKETIGKPSERNDAKYRGVRKRKWGKWVSEIRLPNSRERIWLGSYVAPEKAARAFDAALYCLRGRSAKFNFPDNPPDIPEANTLSRPQIQLAAANFANSTESKTLPPLPSYSSFDELQTHHHQISNYPSPSISISDGTIQTDLDVDTSFLDMLTNMGSSSTSTDYVPDYDIFPGFDDLSNGFSLPTIDYEQPMNNVLSDGFFSQDSSSSLWNF